MALELAISRRASIREWTTSDINSGELSTVLWAANGYSRKNQAERTAVSIDGLHSIVVFVVSTATYRYIAETHALVLWNSVTISEMINTVCWPAGNNYNSGASAILLFVWNHTVSTHQTFTYVNLGSMIQNVYLAANSMGLGTVAQSVINRGTIRNILGLSPDYDPLMTMPLGYAKSDYPAAGPYTEGTTNSLPEVLSSDVNVVTVMNDLLSVNDWSTTTLSPQEVSQLLWAAYGFSARTNHRTVPSAYGVYPMKIYVLTASGGYLYSPETHSLSQTLYEDLRLQVANAAGGSVWAAKAPVMLIIVYNSARQYPDADSTFLAYLEAGLISQELYLEARAWSMGTIAIGNGLEEYNGAGASTICTILGLSSPEVPLYIQLVGHLPTLRNHIIEYDGVTYHVLTSSNSSISNLVFNQPQNEIRFNVRGLDSSKGYCNVTIPKELLKGTFLVLFDDAPITPTLTQNSTHSFIYLEYTPNAQSITEIKIQGTIVIPEFPSSISIHILMVILCGLLISVRRLHQRAVSRSMR